MNLQNTFYVVAIMYMIGQIILFIFISVLLYSIKRKIDFLSIELSKKMTATKYFLTHPEEIAIPFAAFVAENLLNKLSGFVPFLRNRFFRTSA